MKKFLLLVVLTAALTACDDSGDSSNTSNTNNTNNNTNTLNNGNNANNSSDTNNTVEECDGMTEADCVEVHVGEQRFSFRVGQFESFDYDEEGELKVVISIADFVTTEVTENPENFRYQIWGTDGYTFGGYATWSNMQDAYMEVDSRRVIFDPLQELPDSYNVKDAYKITLSPAK